MTPQQKREALERAVKSMLICGDFHFVEEDFEAETGLSLEVLHGFLSTIDAEVHMTVLQITSMIRSLQDALVPEGRRTIMSGTSPLG